MLDWHQHQYLLIVHEILTITRYIQLIFDNLPVNKYLIHKIYILIKITIILINNILITHHHTIYNNPHTLH